MDTKNTTLDDISAEIGFTATLRLSAWFGNDRCYVPHAVEDGQLLVRLIGLSAARKLTAAYPGESLSIPPLSQYESDLRAQQIGLMLSKGFSTRQVANWMRMTERRVQQICHALEQAGLIEPVGPAKKASLIPAKDFSTQNDPRHFHQKMPGEKAPGKTPRKKAQEKAPGKSATKSTRRIG